MDVAAFLDSLPEARDSFRLRNQAVSDLVRGVARHYYPGLYLFGRPGTGKTFTVLRTLEACGLTPVYHRGHITSLGLFQMIDENSESVIVLDDVAAIFGMPIALQILLAALGRAPEDAAGPLRNPRIVCYKRQGVEQRVPFDGGLIVISNVELHDDNSILAAFKSRADAVNYDPTDAQLASLMLDIAEKGYRLGEWTLSPEECREVALFLIEESLRIKHRLDLRIFIDKSLPKRVQHGNGDCDTHWKDLVRMSLEERLVEPHHPPPRVEGRVARLARETALALDILARVPDRAGQVAEWRRLTGESERTLYRRRNGTP